MIMKKIFTLIAMAFMAVGAQAQTWNFKGTVAQTDSYSSDETHWAWADNRWNYLLATNNEALMLGSEELALTKGLKFKAGAANDNKQGKIRVSTNLQLNGKDIVITIPALKKDYTVEVVWKTASGSDYTRYLTTTNLSNISKFDAVTDQTGTPGDDVDKNDQNGTGTVTTDGDVTLKSTVGGVNITSITVKDENGTVLTKDQVVSGSGSQGGGNELSNDPQVLTGEDLTDVAISASTKWTFDNANLAVSDGLTEAIGINGLVVKTGKAASEYTKVLAESSQKTFSVGDVSFAYTKYIRLFNNNIIEEYNKENYGAFGKERKAVASTAELFNKTLAVNVSVAGTLYVYFKGNGNTSGRENTIVFNYKDDSTWKATKNSVAASTDYQVLSHVSTGEGTFHVGFGNGAMVYGVEFVAGSTNGIATVKAGAKADGKWYNLQGQEVAAPTKGIFIKNGKKVVIK